MGLMMSEEEKKRAEKERVDEFVKRISEGPNLRVNDRIMKFTGLDSSVNLRKHYEKRKREARGRAADFIKKLAEKLGPLTPAPALAGLGALAIAVLIDILIHESCSPPEESTEDALRSVFAEEKASEVWDQIDECLKRYRMNIKNKRELVTDMRRIECQLSAALTKLKNSMSRHMSSDALKAWVNGAAFHIQMLIQLVRLGGIQTCDPIEELLSTYKRELDRLFERHKEMIKGKCCKKNIPDTEYSYNTYLVGEDSKLYYMDFSSSFSTHFEGYYNRRYGRQKRDIQQYFRNVGQNLQELIDQRGSFNIS